MSTFAGHKLVRVPDVSVVDPSQSKSLNNLLPRTHAKAADTIPGFQRCPSAEGSKESHEAHCARKHSMRRSASLPIPKLISAFDAAHLGDTSHNAHFTPLSSAAAEGVTGVAAVLFKFFPPTRE
ncbi:hypothetical protein T484DRAFT_1910146 [Baffinella frigidus]|nr:hypothetical protein T484DRAFT_1910146 [Cryptophyta sp. CCMP2293]